MFHVRFLCRDQFRIWFSISPSQSGTNHCLTFLSFVSGFVYLLSVFFWVASLVGCASLSSAESKKRCFCIVPFVLASFVCCFTFVLFVCLGGLFVCLQSSKQTRHDQCLSLMQRCVLVGSLTLQCGVPSSINRLVRLGRYLLAPVKTRSRTKNESIMINDYAWCCGAS